MELHPGNKVALPSSPISHHYELQPILRSPRQQPKTLMVTSSGGDTFRTLGNGIITLLHCLPKSSRWFNPCFFSAEPDAYPDLLNLHPVKSPSRSHQPLNPATLVMPPSPPAQFPHQFQHLIHHKPPPRAHSPPTQSILVSPLLSPPAQFSSGSPKADPKGQ